MAACSLRIADPWSGLMIYVYVNDQLLRDNVVPSILEISFLKTPSHDPIEVWLPEVCDPLEESCNPEKQWIYTYGNPKHRKLLRNYVLKKTTLTASGEKNVFVAEGCLLNH